MPAPDANAELQAASWKRLNQSNPKASSAQFNSGSVFPIDSPKGIARNCGGQSMQPNTFGSSHNDQNSRSYMHPGAAGLSRFANSVAVRGDHSQLDCSNRVNSQWSDDSGHEWSHNSLARPKFLYNKDEKPFGKESSMQGYASKKTRMHYSGPILPPGGNLEELLKDHERQIQQAFRKARGEKTKAKKNGKNGQTQTLLHYGRNGT